MSSTRNVKSPGVFAGDALTTIPPVPIAGVSYRDAVAGAANIRQGWPFAQKVNSAEFNQIMWQLFTLLGIQDSQGLLGWTDLVDYVPGAVVVGSNGALYQAVRASGPATSTQDPLTASTYWVPLRNTPIQSPRNLAATLAANGPAITFTADTLTMSASDRGQSYTVSAFSSSFSVSVTGAGGMDTGSAPTAGFVAIYAIYNPTTGASALLGRTASGVMSDYYAGANMPAGYTASALLAVLRTAAGNLVSCAVRGRRYSCPQIAGPTTTTSTGALTAYNWAAGIPGNAKRVRGVVTATSTVGGNLGMAVAADGVGVGLQNSNTDSTRVTGNWEVDLMTPSTIYFSTSGGGSANFSCVATSYEI